MKATSFTKFGIGLGLTALAVTAVVTPASADPVDGTHGILVGTGSDTTQDVMNGISAAIGGTGSTLRIASYDATGSATITPRSGGVSFARPNGSSQGRDVLRVAIGQTASANTWDSKVIGQVDFARSSSGLPGTADPAGVLTWVPFAQDAVTYAVSANSDIPDLTRGSASDAIGADGVGSSTLWSIYHKRVTKVVTEDDGDVKLVNDVYAPAAGDVVTPLHPMIPQAGSGTRSFWLTQVGLTEADLSGELGSWVKSTFPYVGGTNPVQEHKGAALNGDPGAIVPFSVAQWVAQGNSVVADNRDGAVLGELNGEAPTTGAAGQYAYKAGTAAGAFTRLVYNIISSAEADDASSRVNWAFVGTGSLVCSQDATIAKYGFGVLTATSGANACGDTSRRHYAASPTTVDLAVSTSAPKFGGAFTATVSTTSNGSQGGVVELYDGEALIGSKTLAAGETSAAFTLKTTDFTTLHSYALNASFTPALTGVAEGVSSVSTVAVAKATPVVKTAAKSVRYTTAPKVTVVVAASGTTPTGTVSVKYGTKTLKTATLSDGRVVVTLPKLKVGSYKLSVTYNGSAVVNTGKSATFTLKVVR